MYTFLGLNGWEIEAPQPEVVGLMFSLAAGESSEEELAEWIWAHLNLKERSRRTGESLSALVREAVERMRETEAPLRERARQLIGAFEADVTDGSLRHDDYFADAGSQ